MHGPLEIDDSDGALGPPRYETFVIRQLITLIEARFRALAGRAHRAVFGVSMGGYGALRLALTHPTLFVSAASQSGAVRFTREGWREDDLIFGSGAGGNRMRIANDLMGLTFAMRR